MKSYFGGPIIKLMIAAAIAVVLVNDLGSTVSLRYMLGERATDVARTAADVYALSGSKSRALAEAEIAARDADAILTDFEIVNDRVLNITIEVANEKTWVAHRVQALKPYLNARADHSRTID